MSGNLIDHLYLKLKSHQLNGVKFKAKHKLFDPNAIYEFKIIDDIIVQYHQIIFTASMDSVIDPAELLIDMLRDDIGNISSRGIINIEDDKFIVLNFAFHMGRGDCEFVVKPLGI